MSRSRIRPSVPAPGRQSAASADLLREIVDPHGRRALARSSRAQNRRDWTRVVVASIARGVLATVLGLAFYAAAPAALGWHPTTEMTASMMPRIHTGDVVVAAPVDAAAIQLGKVILFDDPDHPGELRLHRFVDRGDDGMLVTAGDANPHRDSTPVDPSSVWGVGMLRVPWVGLPVLWIHDGRWLFVALVTAALTLLLGLTGLDRGLRTRPQDPPARPPGTTPRARRPVWPARAGAGAAAVLFVAGSLVSFGPTPAAVAAGFSATTGSPTSRLTAGTVPPPAGLTCTDNPDGRTVTIGWSYGGTLMPDSFDVLYGSTVVASATGGASSAVVSTNAIVSLFPSYTLTVRANLTASTAWSPTSTGTTSVKLTGLLLSPVRCA